MRALFAAMTLSTLISNLALPADDPRLKDFTQRVQKYVDIRRAAKARFPEPMKGEKPEQIEAREKALVAAIRSARPMAKQGDIFSPTVAPMFVAILKNNLSGSESKDSRHVVKQGNPATETETGEKPPMIEVNAVYPKSASLSSVPPLLLLQLPMLPPDIEYRFVGRTLVLRDNLSNLIIDYLKEAAPPL